MLSETSAIKIYGERNTGTNYVVRLISLNFPVVRVLPGLASHSRLVEFAYRGLRRLSERQAEAFLNSRRNRFFEQHFEETLGWKHMRVPVERVAPYADMGVAFIALTKNPYSWALSLHRRPYHGDRIKRPFAEFLETPFPTQRREGVEESNLRPMEIWNQKVASYFALKDAAPQTEIIRYEDFLADEREVLRRVARRFDLTRPKQFSTVQDSTKEASKTFNDYRNYYLHELWHKEITAYDLVTINARLDYSLSERCGYPLQCPGPAA